ncbi:MAG: molybdenum cofactor cytidylyltransferase [Verrucomicrobiota bacterium]
MPSVGAIILAAGGSGRLGQPKQLVIFQGQSLVRRAVRAVTARCPCVAVVVGDLGAEIENDLGESSATIVPNAEWRSGLGTSIRCGLRHLLGSLPDLDAVVILACDQPFVEASTIAALMAAHERSGKPIVASSYANTLGIPAFFDRSCFDALLALPEQSGAKAIIESRPDDVASIEFEKGAIDIDTPADFERLR